MEGWKMTNYIPTQEEAHAELIRRGAIANEPAPPGIVSQIGDVFKSGLAGSIKGLEQTGANIISSIPGVSVQVPESIDPTVQWKLSTKPEARTAQVGSEILTPFIGTMLAQKFALGKLAPTAGLLKRAVTSSGIGYLTGPEGMKSLSAALSAYPGATGLTKTAIGRRMLEQATEVSGKYKNLYSNLFKEVGDLPGKQDLRVPSVLQQPEIRDFYKGLGEKNSSFVKQFVKNPTFEHAHEAQSKINSAIREIQNKARKGIPLSAEESNVLKQGQNYIQRLRGSMQQFLTDKGAPELAERYGSITQGFGKEAAPYKLASIEAAKKSKTYKRAKIAQEALSIPEKMHRTGLATKVPGYLARETIEDIPDFAKSLLSFGLGSTIASPIIPYGYQLKKAFEK